MCATDVPGIPLVGTAIVHRASMMAWDVTYPMMIKWGSTLTWSEPVIAILVTIS